MPLAWRLDKRDGSPAAIQAAMQASAANLSIRSHTTPVTTNYDLGMWLVGKGLEKLNPMNTGGTTDLGGFTVSLVRAEHSSNEVVNGTPIYLGNPCGVVIKAAGEPTV